MFTARLLHSSIEKRFARTSVTGRLLAAICSCGQGDVLSV